MAVWRNLQSATVVGGLKGTIDYNRHDKSMNDTTWRIEQDERPFIEQAKIDRETLSTDKNDGMRKFATIPDIVAIEIMEKYGINIHAPETMSDSDMMKRFKYIVATEYAYLLSF